MKTCLLFVFSFILVACSNTKSNQETKTISLENTYWKLVELNGQEVNPPAESKKQYFLELKSADKTISAFAGCNGIGGNYQLSEGNRVRFSNMISTLMACPELETENTFKKVLETVDNYAINGKTLSLSRARMAPMAKFELSSR